MSVKLFRPQNWLFSSQLICTFLELLLIWASFGIWARGIANGVYLSFHLDSFISPVRPSVCTILSRKRSFSKTLFKPGEFEIPASRLCVDGKNFANEAFENDGVNIIMIFLFLIFTQSKIQKTSDCFVLKFLRRSVDGKHLMRFQSGTFVSKFLHRNVNGATMIMHRNWRMNALQHAWRF